jgi:hypothetical protein
MRIATIEQTCSRSPSQWEGRLVDGEPVHIRYRWGRLSVNIGPVGGTIDDALSTERWYDQKVGSDLDGEMDIEEVYRLTGLIGPQS